MKNRHLVFTGLVLLIALLLPLLTNDYIIQVGTEIAMYAALAAGWNLIGGITGYPSFGNVTFFGLGAILAGAFSVNWHWQYGLAGIVAVLIAGAFGFLLGLPILRLKGHYFSIATLALAQATLAVVTNVQFLGGGRGTSLPLIGSPLIFYYIMFGIAALSALVTYLIVHSQYGNTLLAIKSDEQAAQSVGINTVLAKSTAFALSALLGAMVGVVYAIWQSYIDPPTVFEPGITVLMLVMTLIGGAGTVAGPILGAVIIGLLTQLAMAFSQNASSLILGLGIIVVVLFLPQGILGRQRSGKGGKRKGKHSFSLRG
ncbi:Branched-chain amino acid transport system / permease component [Acididesulfobacillus acetoxydans]|uniref:Amino acid/amide ABC transporter membrane protein 2, HAAT n=1 Tax=Acididesulfobacillus acetoxydans TaxID=1561005 RepID=A0A8S0VWT1_9FIRM|nr:branched-chain amino acid ABC transporter permease [Acididesulfobacillus acetoxydans]CAA7601193.1 Branched-chain amino acid transport system / permease component [Acididesulfobacillus acetoxydans]CEJ08528.1 Amino acid/amide ABC transporter membrane protein 2, HAAT [Acididesulfobacillus acetoxydans]